VGISLGALLAGWVVAVGTRSAYDLLVVGTALAFAGSAALMFLLPPSRLARTSTGRAGSRCATGPTLCSPSSTA
jgi:hypothetical protein